jgi:hypothetical protein
LKESAVAEPKYATLVANVAQDVTLDRDHNVVEVTVVDNPVAAVYVRADGTAAVVGADGSHYLPPALGAFVLLKVPTAGNTVVSLKSTGAVKVSVRGVS